MCRRRILSILLAIGIATIGCLPAFPREWRPQGGEYRYEGFGPEEESSEKRPDWWQEEEGIRRYPELPSRKSPIIGVLLAIFPGILLHGIGHWYAGDSDKAEKIATMELYGILGMGAGTGLFFLADYMWDEEYVVGAVSTYISAGAAGIFGLGAFLGTWLYDIIFTPEACRRRPAYD